MLAKAVGADAISFGWPQVPASSRVAAANEHYELPRCDDMDEGAAYASRSCAHAAGDRIPAGGKRSALKMDKGSFIKSMQEKASLEKGQMALAYHPSTIHLANSEEMKARAEDAPIAACLVGFLRTFTQPAVHQNIRRFLDGKDAMNKRRVDVFAVVGLDGEDSAKGTLAPLSATAVAMARDYLAPVHWEAVTDEVDRSICDDPSQYAACIGSLRKLAVCATRVREHERAHDLSYAWVLKLRPDVQWGPRDWLPALGVPNRTIHVDGWIHDALISIPGPLLEVAAAGWQHVGCHVPQWSCSFDPRAMTISALASQPLPLWLHPFTGKTECNAMLQEAWRRAAIGFDCRHRVHGCAQWAGQPCDATHTIIARAPEAEELLRRVVRAGVSGAGSAGYGAMHALSRAEATEALRRSFSPARSARRLSARSNRTNKWADRPGDVSPPAKSKTLLAKGPKMLAAVSPPAKTSRTKGPKTLVAKTWPTALAAKTCTCGR